MDGRSDDSRFDGQTCGQIDNGQTERQTDLSIIKSYCEKTGWSSDKQSDPDCELALHQFVFYCNGFISTPLYILPCYKPICFYFFNWTCLYRLHVSWIASHVSRTKAADSKQTRHIRARHLMNRVSHSCTLLLVSHISVTAWVPCLAFPHTVSPSHTFLWPRTLERFFSLHTETLYGSALNMKSRECTGSSISL